MNAERLLKLAEFLETDERVKDHFYMGVWSTGSVPAVYASAPVHIPCGFAACAVGWCPVVFAEAGWQYDIFGEPKYQKSPSPHWAASEFFDLDSDQVDYLFLPREYPPSAVEITPQQVAERIKDFVSQDGYVPDYDEDEGSDA